MMGSAILGITLTLGTLYLCCAVALAWSAYSEAPRLARILRYSGIFWAIWLTLCFAALGLVDWRCSGNWIYGYTQCAGFSDAMAQTITGFGMLSFAAGIAYGAILLIVGGIIELVVRNRV